MTAVVDVLVTGRVYSDLVFTGVVPPVAGTEVFADAFVLSPGGAANRAVAAARLGASAALLTRFGDDPIGSEVLGMLAAEPDLDLGACERGPGQSPITVAISSGEERSFVTYEEPFDPPGWPVERPVRVAHLGVTRALPAWASELREQGTTIVGGLGWDPTGAWSTDLLAGLASVDVLVVNEAEALGYSRRDNADAALATLAEHVQTVVVTLADRGAVALDAASGRAPVRVETRPVRAVDPTGAGDVFSAAFSAATAWGWPLEDRLRLASAAATCSVTGRGGAVSAPRPPEISRLVADAGPEWSAVRAWAASAPSTTPTPPSNPHPEGAPS